jgi:DNA helicase II / ATP-dependent DNA helicase PcrA
MSESASSPAEQAAQRALDQMYRCIDEGQSFRFEAGAGAGKTYSLIRALEHLIAKRGTSLLRQHQQVACISYTNVASNEITSRIDRHPAIHSSTIHSFFWSLIGGFQADLRRELPSIDKWAERLEGLHGVGSRTITYDELGRRTIDDNHISLYHDDVLSLTVRLMAHAKFRSVLANRYPVLLIDEYQDTDTSIAQALKTYVLNSPTGPMIGLFGDHWQKIYGAGCGKIEHAALTLIPKESNFRSVLSIVEVLNRIRPELPQRVVDPANRGFVAVFHTNDWAGSRLTGTHWAGDLPATVAHEHLVRLKTRLEREGWDFGPATTKILMLTHKVLAAEQGYSHLADVFPYSEAFIKKEDPYIEFFAEKLEPACHAYADKRFGHMFAVLGGHTPAIQSSADKVAWSEVMDRLIALREIATIGAVLDYLNEAQVGPQLSDRVAKREREYKQMTRTPPPEEPGWLGRVRKLREVQYREVMSLARFIEEQTPFSTKHGVKGAQFENVLVVFGRGWNQYDFNQFLEWAGPNGIVPSNKMAAFERNRNLFYVACSRPQMRLCLLFTQRLTDQALTTLTTWFGREAIHSLRLS